MAISGAFGPPTTITATNLCQGAGTPGVAMNASLTNQFPTYALQINGAPVPANSVSPGGYLEINYELSQSVSSGVTGNSFFATFGGYTIGGIVTIPSTNQSYRGSIRIRNIDGQNQLVTSTQSDGTAGAALLPITVDMTKDQTVRFRGYTNSSAGASMKLAGWAVNAWNATASAVATGMMAQRSRINMFYGINHHYTYGNTPTRTDLISAMHLLGFNTMRADWYGRSASSGTGIDNTTWITDMASAMQADGHLNLCIVCGQIGAGSASGTWATELAAYTWFFDQGSYIAALTKPLGVYMYEMGNEVDAVTAIRPGGTTSQGTSIGDFQSSSAVNIQSWNGWRGAMRGLYDGIKSVHPQAMIGSNAFTNASIWASDALWDGVAPDGTAGHPQVKWDWTNWHLYTEGDASNVPYTAFPGPNFNMLKYLHNAYGKPIVITEFNPSQATASSKALMVTWMTTWYTQQSNYNIAGIVWYDWFDSPFQICNADATPSVMNSIGSTLVNFISAHPALK